jgi:hypothetical protein
LHAGAALLATLTAATMSTPAVAQTVHVTACNCLLQPGDLAQVTVQASNPTSAPVGVIVAVQLPSGVWFFLRPVGFSQTPGSWVTLEAGQQISPTPFMNMTLTRDSLPFGVFPSVPPFRYIFAAGLVSMQTGQMVAPFAVSFFDFKPRDPAPFPASPGTLFVVPHQHVDPAWLDREVVNLPLAADYVRQSLLKVQAQPEYKFILDQQPVVEAFKQRYPEMMANLRAAVEGGQAELSGGFFVQADLNLLSGESLVRQAIYGQQYLVSTFGRRTRIAWNIDAFGHPSQMPQIAKRAGMDFYGFGRGVNALADIGGGVDFLWDAPDGSRVQAHYLANSYVLGGNVGSAPQTDAEISELFQRELASSLRSSLLGLSGADVHKQVFNPFMLEALAHWNAQQSPGVHAKVATPSEFFAAVGTGAALPVYSNVEFQDDGEAWSPRVYPGTYASRHEVKRQNQYLEQLLLDTEKVATMASLAGFAYPEAELRAHGEAIARNQTHDYLPGSGVDAIYGPGATDFGGRAATTAAGLRARLNDATSYLTARIATAGNGASAAIVVVNTQAWERREVVTVAMGALPSIFPARLTAADGAEVVYQILDNRDGQRQLAFLATVPAMGYATYRLVPGAPARSPDETGQPNPGAQSIDIGEFAISVDGQGLLRDIVSKLTGRRLLSTSGDGLDNLGNVIWWSDDLYGNAYEYGLPQNIASIAGSQTDVMLFRGPLMTRIVAVNNIAERSVAVREARFVPGTNRIDFRTRLFWLDVNKNVHVRFAWETSDAGKLTEGVPYGFIERGNGHYPVLGWADYGDETVGATLLNRAIFDHKFEGGGSAPRVVDVTLLRSLDRAVFGEFGSETMKQQGVHEFSYALALRHGSWQEARVPQQAAAFAGPALVLPTTLHDGSLPPARSYLSLNPESSAVVTVMQRVGGDVVLRMYETAGGHGDHRIEFPIAYAGAVEQTNLLGDAERSLGSGTRAKLRMRPQEIVTLRLSGVQALTPQPGDLDGDGAPDAMDNCPATPNPVQEDGDTNQVGDACEPGMIKNPFQETLDLAAAQSDITRWYGANNGDQAGISAFARGDIDGDGRQDLIVGATGANGRLGASGDFAGEVYVIYGRAAADVPDAQSLSDAADVTFLGVDPTGFAGVSVASGDVDGDGYDDVLIGTFEADGSSTTGGKVRIFYGGPRRFTPQLIDITTAAATITGPPGSLAGFKIAVADVDADGKGDIVVSAPGHNGAGGTRSEAGSAFVVLGGTRAQLAARTSFASHSDLTLYGRRSMDHFGWGLATGDLDGDGYADLVVGAIDADGPGNNREATGEVYVVWGGPTGTLHGALDMGAPGNRAHVFYGIDETDLAGFSLATGDVDRDGKDDLIVGAPTSKGRENLRGGQTGEVYLLYGAARSAFSATSDLGAARALTLYGARADDHFGLTVAAGDLNGDGHADLTIAAPAADGFQSSRQDSGQIYVVLGRERRLLPGAMDFSSDNADVLLFGAQVFDGAGTSLGTGDFDGDGLDDLAVASPTSRGTDGVSALAGQVSLVLSGGLIHNSVNGTEDRLQVVTSEFDPATGRLSVAVSSSANELALKRQFDLIMFNVASTTRVTDTPYDEAQHEADGGNVVWTGWDGHDTEIYLRSGVIVTQLTDNEADDLAPQVSGGRVVWQAWDGQDFEIMLFDGSVVRQLTSNDTDDVSPRIDAGHVVWQAWDGSDAEILLYTISTGQLMALTRNGVDDIAPRVSQGQVVWNAFADNNWEVFLYTGSQTLRLTNNSLTDGTPDIRNGVAAWVGSDGQDLEVFRYANGFVTRLTDNDVDDVLPQVSSGGIVWQSGQGAQAEVYFHSHAGAVTRLTNNATPDILPRAHGSRVVWQSISGPNLTSEVMLFDGANVVPLSSNDSDDVEPVISGNLAVWRQASVNETMMVAGLGPLTYDRQSKLFVGSFQVGQPPASIDVLSPLGGTASAPVYALPAADANHTIVQISAGGTENAVPRGDWMAWNGWDGTDQEIYLSDGCRSLAITGNAFEDIRPQVHNGIVVWAGRDAIPQRVDRPGEGQGGLGFVWVGGDFEIWKFDAMVTTRLTDNEERDDIEPRIEGDRVVWLGWDGHDFEVFLHDGVTTTQITNNEFEDSHVRISGTRMVWQGWDGNDSEIYLYENGRIIQVTDNDILDLAPEIDGERVVWYAGSGTEFQIYMYEAGQSRVLSSPSTRNSDPHISGNRVVWQGWDGQDNEIFLWDGTQTLRLTNNALKDEWPRIDGSVVVWQGSDGFDSEIFYYTSGQVRRLTGNTWDDSRPEVSSGVITWERRMESQTYMFQAYVPGRVPDACPVQ